MTQLRERVVVVTGASSGIGLEAAKTLADQSWHVVGLGRDAARTASAEAAIRAASVDDKVDMLCADLAVMAEVERAAEEITALTDRIDVLINNAGGMAAEQVMTEEGLEENFAGNFLGPFLLTDRLLPLLRAAAADSPAGSVRIINTSSNASEYVPGLDFDDLMGLNGYSTGRAYCSSKLANLMHVRGLAKQLAADGIVVHALHPGVIDTNFVSHAAPEAQEAIRMMDSITPEEGAVALVWLATSAEAATTSGGYFHKCDPVDPNQFATDDSAVERLFAVSRELIDSARR